MLGHVVLRMLDCRPDLTVFGTVRSRGAVDLLPRGVRERVIDGVEVENERSVASAFDTAKPDVVINCVGIVKQLHSAEDPVAALPVNAVFPHRLAQFCDVAGARLIQVSTDCVFSGSKGMYRESDPSDATDLYGRSKLLGEVTAPHTITLRTSMVGHELATKHGLLEWFLSQTGSVNGYRRAIFSGLPTMEFARVMLDYVLPHPELSGVYHVAAEPINKYELLKLFAREYEKDIAIHADDRLVIDRSLDGRSFRDATGYVAAPWPELVRRMREFHRG